MSDENTNTVEPLEPISGPFDGWDSMSVLHQMNGAHLVREYERKTGERLPLQVRLSFRGKTYTYAVPEERARELFEFPLSPDSVRPPSDT